MMESNNEGLSERLIMVRDHFNYNNTEFAKIFGFSSSAMDSLLKGTNKDTKTTYVGNISTKLGINLNWLINGEGEMFKEGAKVNSNNNTISKSKHLKNVNQTQGDANNNSDASKDVVIESLKRENELLHSQLERANKTIDILLQKK